MWRCGQCRKRTDDIDIPPCGENSDHEFYPQKIELVHKHNKGILLCTGKGIKPGVRALAGNFGITCIACRTKMKEQFTKDKKEQEDEIALQNLIAEEESAKTTDNSEQDPILDSESR